eukprot:CAMPEP_0197940444 /NCGR_PEP_ID=MMETSP1439-20131203/121257_1 /TAXON_ID=66791 /ORGANISM="Gonyaulax spinifera, Strain CCMP409" /LENGTH=83 /DNA_ID=CAMNT_0043563613 /DNA_START=11 /DNA_END=260 /DNA_ORIENTATION=-
MAYLNYEAGEWGVALTILEDFSGHDGPSKELLKYMNQHENVAPERWPGYRELSELQDDCLEFKLSLPKLPMFVSKAARGLRDF